MALCWAYKRRFRLRECNILPNTKSALRGLKTPNRGYTHFDSFPALFLGLTVWRWRLLPWLPAGALAALYGLLWPCLCPDTLHDGKSLYRPLQRPTEGKRKTAISGGFPCHLLRLSISPISTNGKAMIQRIVNKLFHLPSYHGKALILRGLAKGSEQIRVLFLKSRRIEPGRIYGFYRGFCGPLCDCFPPSHDFNNSGFQAVVFRFQLLQ